MTYSRDVLFLIHTGGFMNIKEIDKWLEQTKTQKDDEYDQEIKKSFIIKELLNEQQVDFE